MKYRYSLDRSSKKFMCPNCFKKRFVRYKDNETADYYFDETVGKCDRDESCKYHKRPNSNDYSIHLDNIKPQQKTEITYFDKDTYSILTNELRLHKNVFLNNLKTNVPYPLDEESIYKVSQLYSLGTIIKGQKSGAVCFPFIDLFGNIRAVQVKQFNEYNNTVSTDFLHSMLERTYKQKDVLIPEWINKYNTNELKVSCLFGEHLLKLYPNNTVMLVEAPKSAIYGTLYFGLPKNNTDFIWLAVYNKSSFTYEKMKVLKGRKVIVLPDLSVDGITYIEWKEKAERYKSTLKIDFIFSDMLERTATEIAKQKGLDVADYLITQDWRLFRN